MNSNKKNNARLICENRQFYRQNCIGKWIITCILSAVVAIEFCYIELSKEY